MCEYACVREMQSSLPLPFITYEGQSHTMETEEMESTVHSVQFRKGDHHSNLLNPQDLGQVTPDITHTRPERSCLCGKYTFPGFFKFEDVQPESQEEKAFRVTPATIKIPLLCSIQL